MPVDFECPNCMKALQFPEEAAGRKVQCLKCGEKFRIPTAKQARSKTISLAEPVECPGCKDQLRRDVKLCPRCLWNFETGKKNVVPVLAKEFMISRGSTLVSNMRLYVRRSTKGRWTLTMQEYLFWLIPVGRPQIYDLSKYNAIVVNYAADHYYGPRGPRSNEFCRVYLQHESGHRVHLCTSGSRSYLQQFIDTFCKEAGLRYEQFS